MYLCEKWFSMTYDVIEIANKIISKGIEDENGELVSNMKLQKLLYYEQGFHLAYFNEPLFNDEIEAWMYGPVVQRVYDEFKEYGKKGIENIDCSNIVKLQDVEERLFDEVYRVYSAYSAVGLMEMTHNEAPWNSVQVGVGSVIDKETIRKFFLTRLK